MRSNILVTGSNGQLGSEIKEISLRFPDHNFYFTDREELDICDKEEIENFVYKNGVNYIINCAAYTAVDKAESETELADKINHIAVRNLAEVASENDISLIHISTDYVFNGENFNPYKTDQETDPVNHYGKTKLDGEIAMKVLEPNNSIIIRTSWVYSSFGNNFVKTMLRLASEKQELNVIDDQVGSPTYARDLAFFILKNCLSMEHKGVKTYHYTNEGVCSWFDFAQQIMEIGNKKCKVIPIPTSEYPTPAKRPYYSVMDKTDLKKDFNVNIPYWRDSLKECVSALTQKSFLAQP